jgi:hypothetical protein
VPVWGEGEIHHTCKSNWPLIVGKLASPQPEERMNSSYPSRGGKYFHYAVECLPNVVGELVGAFGLPLEKFMMQNWLGVHEGLAAATRISSRDRIGEHISISETAVLILCGAAAALASAFIRPGLHIPGNAIIRAVIPMALGLSLAPRKFAGFIMSAGALGTAAAVTSVGAATYDAGAFTSLCLIGPMMDFALTGARTGWRLYGGLMLAGLSTNLLALASRAATKLMGLDAGDMRPFGSWWSQAIITYLLCGALAGLIGAICCFRLHRKDQNAPHN